MGKKRTYSTAKEQVAVHPYHNGTTKTSAGIKKAPTEQTGYPKANNKDRVKLELSEYKGREGNKITQHHTHEQKGSLITQVALKIPIQTSGFRRRRIDGGP
jgi:hypothetical protein